MSLTLDKISKLRELADRGIGGEKENAKSILLTNGIDWHKPKETFVNSIKVSLGSNIIKEYSLAISYSSDILLISCILKMLKIKDQSIRIGDNIISFKCTPSESKEIGNLFYKTQGTFDTEMRKYAYNNLVLTKK